MTIEIIRETPIRLTQGEYERLQHQYQQETMYHAGPRISFETWLRERRTSRPYSYVPIGNPLTD
jgi:hypothetical protein